MKTVKLIILIAVLAGLTGVVVWRVGLHVPPPEAAPTSTETKAEGEPNQPADTNEPNKPEDKKESKEGQKPPDEDEAAEPNRPAEPNKPADVNEPNEPNDAMMAVNFKDMEMKDVVAKLADWTGKNIIPCDEVMGQKISIYAPKEVHKSRALELIYSSLRMKKFVAEHVGDTIYLKPLKEAKLMSVPTIPDDMPLASIDNKTQVVQKFFRLQNYSAAHMVEIVSPFVDEYGYVSADEATSKIMVIDTVQNLIRISGVITQFDVPEAERTQFEIFEIHEGDPGEIVQILRMLFGAETGGRSRPSSRSSRDRGRNRENRPERRTSESRNGGTTSVVIGPTGEPVVLIADAKRKWIIAKASPEDIEQIRKWIDILDRKETVAPEYESIPIVYADVREVADRLNEMLQEMPGSELKPSVLVRPLEQARQIIIYGREDLRKVVREFIKTIDMPPGDYEEKTFDLRYADAEQIKANIEELYVEGAPSDWYGRYMYYRYRYGQRGPADIVKVIAFPTMQQVTVIASPENMRKIEVQIDQWDVAIDPDKVKPLILTLHNTDPVRMAQLLTELFTEEGEGRRLPWWLYDEEERPKKKIVGPLYGQLTFEDVPGTKKIVVISKIPEAYKVIERFVRELDKQEMAEVPRVITLKYADPEDLAIRLNAMFNEPGTTAKIWFRERRLSEYSMEAESQDNQGEQNQEQATESEYIPWWANQRRRVDEMPISNVIGRIRFIPDPHSKAVMVLSPPEFIDGVVDMIQKLDVPGRQVRIKAIILQVDHDDLTSLGVQLASNPDSFGTLDENAITALTELRLLEQRGSLRISTLTDVTALVDFLVKRTDAKILNQQTLWTKDNEEADFFKGQKVAFNTDISVSGTGERVTSGIEFQKVGMTLRVRPNITPEKDVDMTVNMIISQLTADEINDQPVRTEMDTETTLIVQDGETIMLGGMLFQEDSTTKRKVPLLGDVPFLGGLFRHEATAKVNRETLVFVTPYVIGEDPTDILPEMKEDIEGERQRLRQTLTEMQASIPAGR